MAPVVHAKLIRSPMLVSFFRSANVRAAQRARVVICGSTWVQPCVMCGSTCVNLNAWVYKCVCKSTSA
eukprot:366328-Chlamydomonas_euryale.AAC.1